MITTVPLVVQPSEWQYLTPLSDLHIDSAGFAESKFRALVKERNEVPNHRWLLMGDVVEAISQFDPRHHPSKTRAKPGRDDVITQSVEFARDVLRDVRPLDLVCLGNHEANFLRRHGVDLTSELVAGLRADGARPAWGGIDGWFCYQPKLYGKATGRDLMTTYHHGAWGGALAKGYNGASRFFARREGWDIAFYGHCHDIRADKERSEYPLPSCDAVVERVRYLVNCGTHQDQTEQAPGRTPDYARGKALSRPAIGAPLISWRILRSRKTDILTTLELRVTI